VSEIKRRHRNLSAFGTGNNGGIGESKFEISVAVDEFEHTRPILLATVDAKRASNNVVDENAQCVLPKVSLDEMSNL